MASRNLRAPSGPGRALAPAVLAAGLVSAVALVFAASLTRGDEAQEGQATLARVSGEVASAVEATARRLLAAPPADLPSLVLAPVAWRAAEPRAQDAEPSPAFDALLAEARSWRRQGEQAQALELVLEAADKDVDAVRLGQARLLAIQLALGLEQPGVASAQWARLRDGLRGDEVSDDTSLLLLSALAVRPALSQADAQDAARALAADWLAGRLALAGQAPRLAPRGDGTLAPVEDPARAALWRRLLEVLPEHESTALTAELRPLLLAAVLAREPGAQQPPRLDGLGFARVAGGWAWWRATDSASPVTRLVLVTDAQLEQRLHDSLRAAGLPPSGFVVSFTGNVDALLDAGAAVVQEHTALLDEGLGITLLHEHPRAFAQAAHRRQLWTRAGLLLAAVFAAGASLATWRALRREARLSQLRTAFVAGVSHELRTPVASIQLLAENLEAGRVPDEVGRARYLSLIQREARRLGRLVNDVLDFARLERGEPARLSIDKLDARAWAQELADDAQQLATRLDAELELRVGELPAEAELDDDALRRAVLNLVDNAARHGRPAGEGKAPLVLELGSDDERLLIRVHDRGRGVPARRRRAVLEPFVTGGAGSGLGLSLVTAIAAGHGGALRLIDPADGGPGLVAELSVPVRAADGAALGRAPGGVAGRGRTGDANAAHDKHERSTEEETP